MAGRTPEELGCPVGSVLDGKFEITRVLGEGGMGVVVEAVHLRLRERVAIKLLQPDFLDHAEAIERFEREARAAFRIQSEHVVRTLDVGSLDNGSPYMVLEFLDGTDLAAYEKRRGRLPPAEAVDLFLQVCAGVAAGHALGIVHRDLKPENVFVTQRRDGSPLLKLIDFGLSKPGDEAAKSELAAVTTRVQLTAPQVAMGTPCYMSPEQWDSARNVGVPTDIWALGVMLYEMLCGQLPFDAGSIPQLYRQIAMGEPLSFKVLGVSGAADLESIALRCMTKDPALRFPSVAELASAVAKHGSPNAQSLAEKIRIDLQTTAKVPREAKRPATSTDRATSAQGWQVTDASKSGALFAWKIAAVAALIIVGTVIAMQIGASRVAPAASPPHRATPPPPSRPTSHAAASSVTSLSATSPSAAPTAAGTTSSGASTTIASAETGTPPSAGRPPAPALPPKPAPYDDESAFDER